MIKKSIAVLLVLVIAGWLLWQSQQAVHYQLQVVNSSPKVVDQVRLFGQGVVQEVAATDIEPGAVAVIIIELGAAGDLRFEVTQGLNQIDTFIEQDISKLDELQQRLEINANNRFIIASD